MGNTHRRRGVSSHQVCPPSTGLSWCLPQAGRDTCTWRTLCMDFTRWVEHGTDHRRHTSPWPRALGIYRDGTKVLQLPQEPATLAGGSGAQSSFRQ